MKIAMPVDENNIESSICISFGRTPYFLIYDTDSNASNFINNSAASSQGGAGIKAAQLIADKKSDILITPRCGENAADVLKAANVKIYKSMNNSIKDNIENMKLGKLSLLDEVHAGFHNHGGK